MEKLIEKANILIEALPYIRKFYDKSIVIKYGGHAMVDDTLKDSFAEDIILLKYVGINVVIVHGGGPQIGNMLKKLNIDSKFISGMRVTDKETMNVVEMVLAGSINKEIVKLINKHGGKAIGLSGKDGNLIKAKKLLITKNDEFIKTPEIIDIGHVGIVESVNINVLKSIMENFIPVIAPIGVDENFETYNINADLVAASVAKFLNAEKLILLTDVPGVLNQNKKLISSIKTSEIDSLKKGNIITGGMIPKIDACADAINGGVRKAHIIDGRIKHSVLLEIFTDSGIGTQVLKG